MGFAVVVKQFRSDFEAVVDLIRRIEVGGQPLGLGDNGLFAHFRVVGIGKTEVLTKADIVFSSFEKIDLKQLLIRVTKK